MLITKQRRQLLSDHKRRVAFLREWDDVLPVWRFVRALCRDCGWTGDLVIPFDAPDCQIDNLVCEECDGSAYVVGIVLDIPSGSLKEVRKQWRDKVEDGWRPEYVGRMHLVGCDPDTAPLALG